MTAQVTTEKKRLTIYVDQSVKEDIEKLAKAEDRTASNFVEVTLKKVIAEAKEQGRL